MLTFVWVGKVILSTNGLVYLSSCHGWEVGHAIFVSEVTPESRPAQVGLSVGDQVRLVITILMTLESYLYFDLLLCFFWQAIYVHVCSSQILTVNDTKCDKRELREVSPSLSFCHWTICLFCIWLFVLSHVLEPFCISTIIDSVVLLFLGIEHSSKELSTFFVSTVQYSWWDITRLLAHFISLLSCRF